MRVFFTGATGVIGRQTLPRLIAAGHDVTAVARTDSDHSWLDGVGARSQAVNLFDASAVDRVVAKSDAVIHMATAIPPQARMAKRSSWAVNDRLRSEATAHLIDASMARSVEVFVQQSITFVYADGGDAWLDEDAPVSTVWDVLDSALEAESHVAGFSSGGGRGVVLRFSSLYGPGRASAEYVASVAARKMPQVGRGDNYVSHLHTHDAATAILAALKVPSGVYNVTDDAPVTKREELRALADTIGAKPPRRVPPWLARMVVGPASSLLTVSHRVANRRFREVAGWAPRFRSVVDGWPDAAGSG